MLFFRDEEHVSRWSQSWRMPVGATLTLPTAWDLTSTWFGTPRNLPRWRRFTLEETEQIFAALGFSGPFWSLRS